MKKKTTGTASHRSLGIAHAWQRSPRRVAIAVLLLLSSAGVLAGGLWYWNLQRPLPEPSRAAEALEHIGTARFKNMPEARRTQYMDKAWSLLRELPRGERRALREKYGDSERIRESMQQRFQQMLVQRAIEFNEATPQERRAMNERFGPRGRRGNGGETQRPQEQHRENSRNAEGSRRDPAHRRERMEQFMETGNPQTGALIVEMFRHLRGEAD
jgi:hypothetical protein